MDNQGTSTRPYLVRALHDWCIDNGFTPYIAVYVDSSVQVPLEYVKNNEIVLNVGIDATSGLKLGNETIEFKARFGGSAREILVPVDHVVAIYARENGQGMAFPVPTDGGAARQAPGEGPVAAGRDATASSASGTPAARGGLRLASSEADSAHPPGEGAETQTDSDGDGEPPPDPGAPSPRPSLKRVK